MARSRVRHIDAPPRYDVYFGMLALTVVAMLVGCAALAIESSEYGWSTEAKAGPAISLPNPGPAVPPVAAGGTPAAPVTPPKGGAAVPDGGMSKAEPLPVPPPSSVATTPPAPAVPAAPLPPAPVAPPVAAAPQPAPKVENTNEPPANRGPRPGFIPGYPRP